MTTPRNRWLAIGALSLSLFACRSTPDVADQLVPPVGGELPQAGATDPAPPAGRAPFFRAQRPVRDSAASGRPVRDTLRPRATDRGAGVVDTYPPAAGDELPQAPATEGDEGALGSAALDAAYVHYELGDYDFAADELRKIRSISPHYPEAQALLQRMERERP